MLAGMAGSIDVIVPRGGKSLIARVRQEARVPVIGHLEGVCHVYVDRGADLGMARRIVLNAKMRRTGICGSAETLLVDRACAATHLAPLIATLLDAGCEVRGDEPSACTDPRVKPATEQDWYEEYLRLCMAIAVVANVEEAIAHINKYSTKHSDSIVTRDEANARKFLRGVDSAAVYWNASTRFTDSAEFGFGAEMGISTQKLHCRGPFALAELTSSKYEIVGTGQVRS